MPFLFGQSRRELLKVIQIKRALQTLGWLKVVGRKTTDQSNKPNVVETTAVRKGGLSLYKKHPFNAGALLVDWVIPNQ